MEEWFADYNDLIAGVSGIATAIGLLAAAAALLVAALQLREQRRLNRATTAYQIQQDARALASHLLSDAARADAVFGRQPDVGAAAIASVINFYSAVYQMHQHHVLNDRSWERLAEDFLQMFGNERAHAQWDASKQSFDDGFVADIDSRWAITNTTTEEEANGGDIQQRRP